MIVDTFMFNDEHDMLECRLETMADAVDYFLAVEADVDHQDHPKPYHLTDNLARFERWADKLIVIRATDLPKVDHDADPWAREWAQRDWVWRGLEQLPGGTNPDTIVLHGDVDEICRPLYVRNVRPKFRQFVLFDQRCHCFAVDWLHPEIWGGTVACTVETAKACGERHYDGDEMIHPGSWQVVRNQRNGKVDGNFERPWLWRADPLFSLVGHTPGDAGWHFSWLGGQEAAYRKLGSFCHPEVADRITAGLYSDVFLRDGWHVDGRKMAPVDVERGEWPDYIVDGRCPDVWFRPREVAA